MQDNRIHQLDLHMTEVNDLQCIVGLAERVLKP